MNYCIFTYVNIYELIGLDGLPDYVFNNNYDLKPLVEVEEYINENKHLPGIPSSNEARGKGVDIGEMQSKLLEKIEEITLYIIELKKENEALKAKIEEIEKR